KKSGICFIMGLFDFSIFGEGVLDNGLAEKAKHSRFCPQAGSYIIYWESRFTYILRHSIY
ncbi:hypothetical protein KKG48_00235, partial [Patescibacteria group bacterium]|nr:hypothetical protein [Patescibacteria group bacterium]